jgi:hypothetical protein
MRLRLVRGLSSGASWWWLPGILAAGRGDEAAALGTGMRALRKAERELIPALRAALAPGSFISVRRRPGEPSSAISSARSGVRPAASGLSRWLALTRCGGPQGDILTMLKK